MKICFLIIKIEGFLCKKEGEQSHWRFVLYEIPASIVRDRLILYEPPQLDAHI
jgi:hypothetical protein